jgi:RNA polymerase sigma-70 factor (ECF subfamily)
MSAALAERLALDLSGVFGLSLHQRAFRALEAKGEARVRAEAEKASIRAAKADELAAWMNAVSRFQDRDAFAALHRHFAPRLAGWMARAGLNAAQIDDIVQDCMVTIWRKAPLYNPTQASVATWIFTIARNLRVDHARRRANRDMAPLGEWDEMDDAPDGEGLLLAAESETQVRKALDELPSEQKQVLMEAYFADKPQSAIAQDLGLPLGTVKSRLRLALAKLRALLEETQ